MFFLGPTPLCFGLSSPALCAKSGESLTRGVNSLGPQEAIMAAKLVTIFGGSGFVGRHTVRALARAGYRVRVAVRRPHTAHFLRPLGDVGQVELVQANIRDDNSVRAAVDGADVVINLVGILFEGGKQKFAAVQAEGAGRVGEAAALAGASRFIHVSAIGAEPKSSSKYARSKAQGEELVRASFAEATILRPSIIFGPEDDFFNRFAALARFSPFLPLIGGGNTRFQPVFVGDVADAILRSLEDHGTQGRTFELGGPRVYTFKEVLQYILQVVGRKRLLLPLPFGLAKFQAFFLGLLPNPMLTMDQVELLKSDNVVGLTGDETIGTLSDLGIAPKTVDAIVPSYLERYRRLGQYENSQMA